jgi:signal transduction histidine kinase/CheY-like chemotaxis protein
MKKFHDLLEHLPPPLYSELKVTLEESFELIEELEENSSVAVTTLTDLINYDKIETKSFSIEKKDVDIWSVVEKAVSPLTIHAKEKNIQMELVTQLADPCQFPTSQQTTIDIRNLRVVGDAVKVAQVIRNLVSNALKFSSVDGDVKISGTTTMMIVPSHFLPIVYFQPREEPPSTGTVPRHKSLFFPPVRVHAYEDLSPDTNNPIGDLVITVTDTGPGLSLVQQKMMFEEGVQFNPNELQAGQGSGLGLWISREIVRQHHGQIRVQSRGISFGSTFQVTLPVVLRDVVSSQLKNSGKIVSMRCHGQQTKNSNIVSPLNTAMSASQKGPDHLSGLSVLVVDDAPSNRKLVSRLLKSKGIVCQEAENGREAVTMVMSGDHHFQVILMDYEMPVMDGPSAAKKLRDLKCELLIIGLTGNVLPEDKEYFLNNGANFVLSKPLNVKELLEIIEQQHLSQQQLGPVDSMV